MKNNILTSILTAILFLALFSGCNNEPSVSIEQLKNESIKKDSIQKAKNDSIKSKLRNLNKNKKIEIGDKTVELLESAKLKTEVCFEFENTEYNTYYRSKESERGNTFLIVKIKLTSKSKWETGDSNFLPKISIIQIKSDSTLKRIGTLEYNFFQKPDRNYYCIEDIFNYKESATFICYAEINKNVLESKLFVCIDNDKLLDNIIDIIEPKNKK